MAAVQQRILNWLYSVLTSEYQDVNRTYNDVAQTLSFYSSLNPKTEVYTYESGTSALLLQLSGTLPVVFRGTTYRFPVTIWIPHEYPRDAPLVYVTPTEGMVVRAGQHVDPQGKVYHPYLVGWPEFWDKSNVLDFLAILRDVFAKEPPVVARQQIRTPVQSPQPVSIPPPLPPHPPDITHAQPLLAQNNARHPPPPPPKQYVSDARSPVPAEPSRGSGPPLPPLPPDLNRPSGPGSPAYQNAQAYGQQATRQAGLRYDSAPPLPSQSAPSQAYRASAFNPVGVDPSRPQYSQSPPPIQYNQYPPRDIRPVQPQQFPPNPNQSYGPPGQPQYQQQYQQPPQQPKPKPAPPVDLLDGPLTLSVPSQSTPVHPPPIPPNPQKDMLLRTLAHNLHAQRQQYLTQSASSLPGLRAQNSALLSALQNMQNEHTSLTTLSQILNTNTQILHTALRDSDKTIQDSKHREAPKVDEILVAPTVVGNQLYDLVNEERALGDTLFVLGRAVERGRIGAGTFVKSTRSLAREWFLKKALVRKIGRGMGLD